MKNIEEFNKKEDSKKKQDSKKKMDFNRKKDYKKKENSSVKEDLGNIIEGRNAVVEALKNDRTIENILINSSSVGHSLNIIYALAKEKKIVIKEVDKQKLNAISETGNHQGVIAIVNSYEYSSVEEILNYAEEKGEKPFIIILDEIEDPHNFGSIIRTAEIVGVHGIIIPKRRNVAVTPTVHRTSVGAVEHMKIAKVTNINATIDDLKEKGVWIYGADINGEAYCHETNMEGAIALVIGSEGRGISRLTLKKCDVLVKIPMVGKINSLNASVAGGILMYEVLRQKLNSGKK